MSFLQDTPKSSGIFDGKFVCVKRWKLSGQVESLSVIEGRNGTSPAILVSQPGAGYIYLFCSEESMKEDLQKQTRKLVPKVRIGLKIDCKCTSCNKSVDILHATDLLSASRYQDACAQFATA